MLLTVFFSEMTSIFGLDNKEAVRINVKVNYKTKQNKKKDIKEIFLSEIHVPIIHSESMVFML